MCIEVAPIDEKAAAIVCLLAEACFIETGVAVATRIENVATPATLAEPPGRSNRVAVGEAEL